MPKKNWDNWQPRPTQSEATKRALAILAGAETRSAVEASAEMKARQDAGQLTPHERLLSAIFGEIK
jgi:hypothetical protein